MKVYFKWCVCWLLMVVASTAVGEPPAGSSPMRPGVSEQRPDGIRGTVAGTVRYEKVPCRHPRSGAAGLQIGRPELRTVAGARVELVAQGGRVIARGRTDAQGRFSLPFHTRPEYVQVRVLADAENAVVVDHHDPKKVYSISSKLWRLQPGEATCDLTAVDTDRGSGPFNILECIRLANQVVRSAEPGIAFPQLRIRWTTRHRADTSYFARGENQAYILGDRVEDSDEFDDFIVVHEYGHYLAAAFSRDDSLGGMHGLGDRLDPRLAWGEGFANFFACAVLNDPLYVDSGRNRGDGSNVRLMFDLDEDRPNGDRAGYWSEHSVGSTLWDIFDKRPGRNHLGVGFVDMWKVLRSEQWKNLPPYRNLIDFCDLLVERRPELRDGVARILAARGIQHVPGRSPHPYVRPLPARTALEGELDSTRGRFERDHDARGVFTFTLTKKTKVKLHLAILASKNPQRADLELALFAPDGRRLRLANETNGVGGSETIELELDAGRYCVEVQSWARLVNGTTSTNTGRYRLTAEY